ERLPPRLLPPLPANAARAERLDQADPTLETPGEKPAPGSHRARRGRGRLLPAPADADLEVRVVIADADLALEIELGPRLQPRLDATDTHEGDGGVVFGAVPLGAAVEAGVREARAAPDVGTPDLDLREDVVDLGEGRQQGHI